MDPKLKNCMEEGMLLCPQSCHGYQWWLYDRCLESICLSQMSIFRIFLLLWLVDSLHLREDAVSQLMKNCEPIVYVSALLSVYPYLWSMQRCRWALIYLSIHGARLGPNPKQSVIWAMSIRRDPVFENGSNAAGIAIPESKCTYSGCHCLYEHGNNDLRRMRISASPSNFLCGGTCDLYDHRQMANALLVHWTNCYD